MVQFYNSTGLEKHGVWSDARIVLQTDKHARTIIVSKKSDGQVTIAKEYVGPAVPDDTFASAVQTAIGTVEEAVEVLTQSKENEVSSSSSEVQPSSDNEDRPTSDMVGHHEDASFSNVNEKMSSNKDQLSTTVNRGDRVLVIWSDDETHYPGTMKHLHRDGQAPVFMTVEIIKS